MELGVEGYPPAAPTSLDMTAVDNTNSFDAQTCRFAMAANAEGICARENVFDEQTLQHILSFHATSAASWYRPLLGSSLWELEDLRTEWHMSATGTN